MKVIAAAPTGIAAANIEIEGADVSAATLHNIFQLGEEGRSLLDFDAPNNVKVKALAKMNVLLIDEISMVDLDLFGGCAECLATIDQMKRGRPADADRDPFGQIHLLLFGDYKQVCLL